MSVEVVVEGRQGPDHAAHDRHRMRIAPESAEEGGDLFVHHGVVGDGVQEIVALLAVRQVAVQQQVGNLEEMAVLGEFLDRVAAVQQDPRLSVDVGQAGLA